MKTVAIIDYGTCNLGSVARAVEECGGTPLVTTDPHDLQSATHIILPGVGSFAYGMKNLQALNMPEALAEQALRHKIPFLGVCLGMQLLAQNGNEGGGVVDGLGWIDGEVARLQPQTPEERIPHVGWNEIWFELPAPPLFENIEPGKDFYFVHSYHFACKNKENVLAYTPFAGRFVSAVRKENIWGVQFHPEKSQRLGMQIIRNFLEF